MPGRTRRAAFGLLSAAPAGLAGAALASSEAWAKAAPASLASRMDEMESHRQIIDVLYLYARGWDRLDEAILRACFWPDSRHQHGGFKGLSQDFITRGLASMAKVKGSSHLITNPWVQVKGDKALSECYFLAHHRRTNRYGTDEEDYFIKGRYLDRFERRGGVWKIASRRGLSDFERIEARADGPLATAPDDQLSHRGAADPLYAMIADFEAGR
jgi:hypothetical protein